MFEYAATILRVVDGDTVDLKVDLGFRHFMEDRFRMAGINAPDNENVTAKKAATAFLSGLLPVGTKVKLKTDKDETEKYGRWLGIIWISSSALSVNTLMLDNGHAVIYTGGPRA